MSRTYTPELPLNHLDAYAERFRPAFNRPRQAAWCDVYLRGLLADGERKSIEPMAGRLARRLDFDVADPDQALQQFVNQSTWDEQDVGRRYRDAMAEAFADPHGLFVIDDTSFPKQGRHSVGVQRQYCGALGERANCQSARRATARWRCGCTCPNSGWATRSGSTRSASPRPSVAR